MRLHNCERGKLKLNTEVEVKNYSEVLQIFKFFHLFFFIKISCAKFTIYKPSDKIPQ
jgi:hypothetical protein